MKKWFFVQLSEITAWCGVVLMVLSILHIPYFWFFMLGAGLLAVDDEWFKGKMVKWSPAIKRAVGE